MSVCATCKKDLIKIAVIKTHDEGEFTCEYKKESIDKFLKNYKEKNEERLKVAGHTQLIQEIREEMVTEDEFRKQPATYASALYFNGLDLTQ